MVLQPSETSDCAGKLLPVMSNSHSSFKNRCLVTKSTINQTQLRQFKDNDDFNQDQEKDAFSFFFFCNNYHKEPMGSLFRNEHDNGCFTLRMEVQCQLGLPIKGIKGHKDYSTIAEINYRIHFQFTR